MSARLDMTEPRAWARVAGLCWLMCIGCGIYAEGFVRAKLVVHGDAVATIHNILINEATYRLAAAAEFIGTAAYLVLTAIMYRLLAPVNKTVSLIAAFFSIVGCTIWILGVADDVVPFMVFSQAHAHGAIATEPMQTVAFAFVRLQGASLTIGMICFGVQCFLMGLLIVKSTFLPKLIGIVLVVGGAGYFVTSIADIASLPIGSLLEAYGNQPGAVGELLMGLWLTVVGVNPAKWKVLAGSTEKAH